MCGVLGIVGKSPVAQSLYDGLTVLQHRGQDAAGILTCDENGFVNMRKDNGLVKDVFFKRHMQRLTGNIGIGHCRYPTAGSSSPAEAQPFYVNSPFGIALGHNGNLTNASKLRSRIFRDDLRHVNTSSDSEILLNVFAHEIYRNLGEGSYKLENKHIFKAVEGVFKRCHGGYGVVAFVMGVGLVAFRDKFGIRPLIYGYRETAHGREYMVASESVALDSQGFTVLADVRPGECIILPIDGEIANHQCVDDAVYAPCIFEQVYLARPDSMIDGISVYRTRMRMGEKLAKKIAREWPDHDIDVVIPIPDTSRTAALEMSQVLGVTYREGFIKNRYIGRTFIMPGQEERKKSVRQKLNAIGIEFEGKNVMLVDDSIVRGTTSKQIVQMARESGANNVYFASAAPPVRYPNVYGIDMPAADELMASNRTVEQVEQSIGADRLFYQDLHDLIAAASEGNPQITKFDTSCFSKEYVTGDVDDEYFSALELLRSDDAKRADEAMPSRLRDMSQMDESS
ncbi:amidophosphoribosyltransferase [Arenicella sp. 4NH20-0111]|uniref:amidophosphoribosyltransferase n=1 Tax=Arenicella sp. 4NH20-0111 TaxID=3127648 RepID=UPI003106D7FE